MMAITSKTYVNKWEHTLVYWSDHERKEVVLSHLPGQPPIVIAASYPCTAIDTTEETPTTYYEYSIEEARLRFAFFMSLVEAGRLT